MQRTLNSQLAAELYSAYLYFSLACDFGKIGLMGFAHWLVQQWREENAHALDIAEYIVGAGGEVRLDEIKAAIVEWECPCEAMGKALEHEELIADRIGAIVTQAREEKDYATEAFVMRYVREQTEEIATLNALHGKLEMIGEDPAGLMHLDRKLSERPNLGL
jgi:ferritin